MTPTPHVRIRTYIGGYLYAARTAGGYMWVSRKGSDTLWSKSEARELAARMRRKPWRMKIKLEAA